MASVAVNEHGREDILPSVGRGITIYRVWAFFDPVSFCDDLKWEQRTGIERVAL